MHELYCRLSGVKLPLSLPRIWAWERFMANHTENDLRLVVRHLRNKIRLGRKWSTCLLFSNLIQNEENFTEALGEARSIQRAPKPHAADSALRATGRPPMAKETTARSAAQILEAEKAFQELVKLRKSL